VDSDDSDDWIGDVDVEEYKRLRNTVKLRLDDCDHEVAGQLDGDVGDGDTRGEQAGGGKGKGAGASKGGGLSLKVGLVKAARQEEGDGVDDSRGPPSWVRQHEASGGKGGGEDDTAEAEEEMAFETAMFGVQEDVSGEIVRADPLMADRELENRERVKGKVVVVCRGGVPFVDKARRVMAAGAVCMVVVNNADELYKCTGQGEDVKIPVVCVSKGDGELLGDGSMVKLKGVQYGAGTLCYTRQVAPKAGGGDGGKGVGGGMAGMGLSLGGAAKVGVPVTVGASSGKDGSGEESDEVDSDDSDDWIGDVDVEEYKRLRNTVKLRLDDCDHEVAGQLDGSFVGSSVQSVDVSALRSNLVTVGSSTATVVSGVVTPLDSFKYRSNVPATLPIPSGAPKVSLVSLTPLPPSKCSFTSSASSPPPVGALDVDDGNISRKLTFSHDALRAPSAVLQGVSGATGIGTRAALGPGSSTRAKVKAHQLRALPSLPLQRVSAGAKGARPEASAREGGLSKLTSGVDMRNPKFQLAMNAHRAAAAQSPPNRLAGAGGEADADGVDWHGVARVANNDYYFEQRHARALYRNTEVHCMVLELAILLLLDAEGPLLDRQHTLQFPLEKHRPNMPLLLRLHLNHAANEQVLPQLLARVSSRGQAAHRLLKLLVIKLFQPSRYCNRDPNVRFRGAFGTVYRVLLPSEPFEVAIKVIELPKDMHAPCSLQDLFSEVSILQHLRRESRVSHIYDYGVDRDHCYIVTAWYRMSLKHWRTHQPADVLRRPGALALLMSLGARLLQALCRLADARVVHYDIKCDNVLLVADRAISDAELLDQGGRSDPAFDLVITDFGESKLYGPAQDGYTTRNRGTEYIKSPEMLTVANASSKERANFDRRKKVGVNKASDAWSAACLLYEVLTGDFLFYDDDWIRFFIRVTGASPEQTMSPERLAPLQELPGGAGDLVIDFFNAALVRDPLRRPSMQDLSKRWDILAATIAAQEHPRVDAHAEHAECAEGGAPAESGADCEGRRGEGKGSSSAMPAPAVYAQQVSASRVLRDPMRASALLLHEAVGVADDGVLRGKSAVSVGWEGSGRSIFCGAGPLDISCVDGKPIESFEALGVGHLLDCTATPAAATHALARAKVPDQYQPISNPQTPITDPYQPIPNTYLTHTNPLPTLVQPISNPYLTHANPYLTHTNPCQPIPNPFPDPFPTHSWRELYIRIRCSRRC
jgi:hypothetical protein